MYRLQPQFSHLVENSNGQPIIVDGNNFQLMEDSGQKSQSIMTLQGKTSESALRGVSELPPQFLASDTDRSTQYTTRTKQNIHKSCIQPIFFVWIDQLHFPQFHYSVHRVKVLVHECFRLVPQMQRVQPFTDGRGEVIRV